MGGWDLYRVGEVAMGPVFLIAALAAGLIAGEVGAYRGVRWVGNKVVAAAHRAPHHARCPVHGVVGITERQYLEFLCDGPIQDLTAAIAHELSPEENPDLPVRHYTIKCPKCGRASEVLHTEGK